MISTGEKRCEEIKKLRPITYTVAKGNLPFAKYEKLCSLQQLNGMELGQSYLEIKGCKTYFARDYIQSKAKSVLDGVAMEQLMKYLNTNNNQEIFLVMMLSLKRLVVEEFLTPHTYLIHMKLTLQIPLLLY